MVNNLNIRLGNVGIVETGISYGNMNAAKRFYPETYSAEDRSKAFMENRLKVGKDFGFDDLISSIFFKYYFTKKKRE